MRRFKVGTNVAIFLLFFGVALLDAVRGHNWLQTALWIGVGAIFLRADMHRERSPDDTRVY